MKTRTGLLVVILATSVCISFTYVPCARAQQTLGGITGAVADKTGGVLLDTVVTIVGDQTFAALNDPIGPVTPPMVAEHAFGSATESEV